MSGTKRTPAQILHRGMELLIKLSAKPVQFDLSRTILLTRCGNEAELRIKRIDRIGCVSNCCLA